MMSGTPHKISAQQVINAVAADVGLLPSALLSKARYRSIARPRQIAMLLTRRLCPHLSYPDIGRRLGGRDHTTVLHGVRKVLALMPLDPELKAQVERIEAHLVAVDLPSPDGLRGAVPFGTLCAGYAAVMRPSA